ncbi:MAG: VWA domain-containing protein [Alphaproteobacteria bacterium]|nr:VWA domain-containing protein [Alphaproteobacteria bacterium]MCB9696075.1 VWA domain-containing protein [Alphaproteobacteria bacterium]
MADDRTLRAALRWRLVLGSHADGPLDLRAAAEGLSEGEADLAQRRDGALAFLYDREQERREHRRAGAGGPSTVAVPRWLADVRRLFPKETVEVVERDALVRYGLRELVTDAEVLAQLEPTEDLLKVLLSFREHMAPDVLREARRMVRRILDDLTERIRATMEPALRGRARGQDRRPPRTFRNADWHRTIRRNLGRWDRERERIVADRIDFRAVQRQHSALRVVIAVDTSGSMLDSVIHAAVCASILAGLPSVRVDLLLWDHRVVDVSDRVRDPLEVLFAAQLGGGTKLLPALRACAERIEVPERTVLAVVSDWFVYDEVRPSIELAAELAAAGVRCFGLCALDAEARPNYDARVAAALADAGWWVGAVTPRHLAEQLARVL